MIGDAQPVGVQREKTGLSIASKRHGLARFQPGHPVTTDHGRLTTDQCAILARKPPVRRWQARFEGGTKMAKMAARPRVPSSKRFLPPSKRMPLQPIELREPTRTTGPPKAHIRLSSLPIVQSRTVPGFWRHVQHAHHARSCAKQTGHRSSSPATRSQRTRDRSARSFPVTSKASVRADRPARSRT
jgi:hypothetical protein